MKKTKKSSSAKGAGGRSRPAAPSRLSTGLADAPRWIWVLCIVFLGIVFFCGYEIFGQPAKDSLNINSQQIDVALPTENTLQPSTPTNTASARSTTSADVATATTTPPPTPQKKTTAPTDEKPRFSFYSMLPKLHVNVPGENQSNAQITKESQDEPHEVDAPVVGKSQNVTPEPSEQRPAAPSHHQAASQARNPNQTNNQTANAANSNSGSSTYVIQAGVFSQPSDAEHRKAQLALLGVSSNVTTIHNGSGETLYRVQSNALDSRNQAESLAGRLQSHGIETFVHPLNH